MSSFRKCDRKFQFKLEKNKVIADKCKQQKKPLDLSLLVL